jgi:integrase
VATVTVAEVFPLLEQAKREELASWRDYVQRWRDHVGPAFGRMRCDEVDVANVDRYRAARRAAGAAIATINREIALLRRLLSFAIRRKLLARSNLHGPGMTAELIHREHNIRTTIVEDDPRRRINLRAFLDAAAPELRVFILLVHRSGMRREEASLLQWDRIDWDHGTIWIPGADTKGETGGRVVPLDREVRALLRLHRRRDGSPYVFATRRQRQRPGQPVHKDVWTHRFGRLVRKLGLEGPDGPPWLHDLRRSFVTLSRRRGESERGIMNITAHKTRAVFDRYDVYDLTEVIRFRRRQEAARRRELQAIAKKARRPPRASSPTARPSTAREKTQGSA